MDYLLRRQSEQMLDPRPMPAKGWRQVDYQQANVAVHRHMMLATDDLLGSIVAAHRSCSCRFHRLAVEHICAWPRLPTGRVRCPSSGRCHGWCETASAARNSGTTNSPSAKAESLSTTCASRRPNVPCSGSRSAPRASPSPACVRAVQAREAAVRYGSIPRWSDRTDSTSPSARLRPFGFGSVVSRCTACITIQTSTQHVFSNGY